MPAGIWMSSEDLAEIDAQAEADGKEIERLTALSDRLESAVLSAAGMFNHLVADGEVTAASDIAEIDAWLDLYVPGE